MEPSRIIMLEAIEEAKTIIEDMDNWLDDVLKMDGMNYTESIEYVVGGYRW